MDPFGNIFSFIKGDKERKDNQNVQQDIDTNNEQMKEKKKSRKAEKQTNKKADKQKNRKAEKLRKWSQLRNTAFYKLFLKQSEFKSPCNSATLLKKNISPNLSLSRKAERVLATAQHCFPQTIS